MNKKKGFTLTELVVVIVIIGILAAVLIPTLTSYIKKARYSNDVALVNSINKILSTEEILENSPNDAIECQRLLEEHGLVLETQSEGNYIWVDESTHRAVLARFGEEGSIEIVDRVNAAGEAGSYMTDIIAPEKFVEGYWFITKKSKDGFAQVISDIRNGQNLDSVFAPVSAVEFALEKLISTSAFINSDGEYVTADGVDNTNVKHIIVSGEATSLNISPEDVLNLNIVVIDLPSNIETLEGQSAEALNSLTNTVITYNNVDLDVTEVTTTVIFVDQRKNYIGFVELHDFNATLSTTYENYLLGVHQSAEEFRKYSDMEEFIINEARSLSTPIGSNISGKVFQLLRFEVDNFESNPIVVNRYFDFLSTDSYMLVKNNNLYYSCSDVVTLLNAGAISGVIQVFGKNNVIDEDVTIPAGVTLALCYSDDATDEYIENGYMLDDSHANTRIYSPKYQTAYSILAINEGITVINDGKIICGAQVSAAYQGNSSAMTSFLYDGYSWIINNGTIKSTGAFNAYGFLTGSGKVEQTSGVFRTVITLEDWDGFSNALVSLMGSVMPFTNWTLGSLRQEVLIKEQGSMDLFGTIKFDMSTFAPLLSAIGDMGNFAEQLANVAGPISVSAKLFGKYGEEEGHNNHLIEYKNNGSISINNDGIITTIKTNGEVVDREMTVDFDIKEDKKFMDVATSENGAQLANLAAIAINALLNGVASLDSETWIIGVDVSALSFPMANMDLYVESGSLTTSNIAFKFLPGSSVYVESEAVLNVKKEFGFYQDNNFRFLQFPKPNGVTNNDILSLELYDEKDSAMCHVAGTINVTEGGRFGGILDMVGSGTFNFEEGQDNIQATFANIGYEKVSVVMILVQAMASNGNMSDDQPSELFALLGIIGDNDYDPDFSAMIVALLTTMSNPESPVELDSHNAYNGFYSGLLSAMSQPEQNAVLKYFVSQLNNLGNMIFAQDTLFRKMYKNGFADPNYA